MKILALSDEVLDSLYSPRLREMHGDADLVLGCGDLPFYYLEFIVTILNVPVYYIPGNHDRMTEYRADGTLANRAGGCEPLDAVTARTRIRLSPGPLLLAGLGGSLRYNAESGHQYTQEEMWARAVRLIPALVVNRLQFKRYLDILVTHAPPRGIHDGQDLAHTGFDAFLWLMRLFKPRWLLHGHSHVYRRDTPTTTQYHATQVMNVYPARVLDWNWRHE